MHHTSHIIDSATNSPYIRRVAARVCDKKQITQRINPALDSTRVNGERGSRKRRTFQSTDSRTRVNLSRPRRHLPRRPSDQLAPRPLKNLAAADVRRRAGSDSNKPSCSRRGTATTIRCQGDCGCFLAVTDASFSAGRQWRWDDDDECGGDVLSRF